ncbi:CD225/dispanin family protein [Roseivirga sp. BDSF3-8]|uniref:CD225/dispanin family protein n=1 Tax=Roseivirga sp. BDSF3-8 TaxID=3241598 RepID=UPI003531E990
MNDQKPPKTWLVESILVTIFCCLPLGIVGIINASKVEGRFHSGDIQGAMHASKEAGKWTKIGAIIGIAGVVIYILMMALGIGGAMLDSGQF